MSVRIRLSEGQHKWGCGNDQPQEIGKQELEASRQSLLRTRMTMTDGMDKGVIARKRILRGV